MPLSEFEIISQYFRRQTIDRDDVVLGIGDDCALLQPRNDELLAVSMDTLVSGIHFPEDTCAFDIGHKALAVNLSDLAAMGAQPQWATLGLTLPDNDNQWLAGFCEGMFKLAQQHDIQLVGGDLTRGPLTITIQVHGSVPGHQVLRRNGAQAGDGIYVTGTVGDAAVGLALKTGQIQVAETESSSSHYRYLLERLNRPSPRIDTGLALRNLASSAIDISDGLAADLGHILNASDSGARIDMNKLPISGEARKFSDKLDVDQLALTGGDDYELCFTVPEKSQGQLKEISKHIPITNIGSIESEPGLRCYKNGELLSVDETGFRHF